MTREQQLNTIWRTTHRDFKGTFNGERTIMVYRNSSCLVRLEDLTEREIADRLPKRKEGER